MGTFEDLFTCLYVTSLCFCTRQEIGQDMGQYHGVIPKRISLSHKLLLSFWCSINGVVPASIPLELCRLNKKTNQKKKEREGVEYTVDLEVMVSATSANFLHYQQSFSLTSATSSMSWKHGPNSKVKEGNMSLIFCLLPKHSLLNQTRMRNCS